MKMSQMFPSNYLGKDDVAHPVQTSITRVVQEELKGDGGNELKTVLYFQGVEKGFICNKTNAFTLVDAYGDDSDHWIGKAVELYVDPNVTYGGKRVGGVRVRLPAGGGRGPQTQTASFWTYPQAVAECAKVGIDGPTLVAHLKKSGNSGYVGLRDTPTVKALIAAQASQEQSFDDGPQPSDDEIAF